MKKIIISDVTLRDGNHAVNHSINIDVVKKYCEFAEKAKLSVVEVGHGNGIGASSLSIGRSAVADQKLLKTARLVLKKTKLSVHSIPGFSTIDDLKSAIDSGVDIFRIGCNSTEIDIIERQVDFCKKNKVETWGVLMMFHLINQNNEYLKKIEFLKKIGLKTIIIMDSAGCLIPSEVKNIFLNLKKFKINFGFHAHNNLGCAIWNTVEAYDNGANILDASIRGFGAGAGNAQLEILLTILKKRKTNSFNNFDISRIYEMADKFKSLLVSNSIKYNNAFSQSLNILSANYGLFSGFASQVSDFSERFKVNKLKAFEAIGKKKLVAGQEDLIMNVIFNLSNKKKKNNIDIK
jgi:4-hydroxy 2-oxovalerate aldolase